MRIAITGATGFFGRYIVNHLLDEGHECRCWHRPDSDLGGFRDEGRSIRWVPGELNDPGSTDDLVRGADTVVHAAVEWGRGADLAAYAQANITGSLRLMESARAAGARRFVFISTCAVHERILEDRPLDEAHPLWPASHYGAAKASVEKFLHSFALGHDWCATGFRPPGIYGLRRPLRRSHWYDLVRDVLADRPIRTSRGGKVLDAADGNKALAARILGLDRTTLYRRLERYGEPPGLGPDGGAGGPEP